MLQPPRDYIEIELCRIWQSILGDYVAGIDQNFFLDLGGTSRAAVELVLESQNVFGVRLKLADVLAAPTVRTLTEKIVDQGIENHATPVVRIQNGDKEMSPLYLFHPLPGTLVRYFELIRALGLRHTIWGLQSLGIEEDTVPLLDIHDMADAYVSHMRREHPGGPWRLAGYSMGGNIAFEAARQLESLDEEVELVCLLDSGIVTEGGGPIDVEEVKSTAVQRLALLMLDVDIPMEELGGLSHEKQVDAVLSRGTSSGALASDNHVRRFLRFLDVRIKNHIATLNYRPSGPYRGKLTLIRASDSQGYEEDIYNGWNSVASDIDVYNVPGDHLSMMSHPYVEQLADIVQRRIQGARGSSSA
ncbi:non-ribosomal peptide synthetase [Nocardia asiatica]|uniref:thioesterase domain-containing protein n=1 Tax=Nocardia asiatica TaxID=209252 RepID=UPI00245717A9|nr:non-ribosomal peptide synthetase [Nocardia asiatica]